MTIYVPQHDERLMPMTLGYERLSGETGGSVVRTPAYSWPQWGITYDFDSEFIELLDASERAYRAEWDAGTPEQHKIVAEASMNAGFGDHNAKLRAAAAKYIREVVNDYSGHVSILDIGAGAGDSALEVYRALSSRDKKRAKFTLLEPAKLSLEKAVERMKVECASFECVNVTDNEIGKLKGDYDVIMGVASVHHHAQIPWFNYKLALKNGGRLVIADWHNGVWADKGKVYEFLKVLGCSMEGLEHFENTYKVSGMATPLTQADKDIFTFWKGYVQLLKERGQQGKNAIWPLEGHRPADRYLDEMDFADFKNLKTAKVLENTELLGLTVAQKKD